MTTPTGIRLRQDQRKTVDKFQKKTGFTPADYVRAGVDLLSQQSHEVIIEKIVLSRTNGQKKT